MTSLTIGRADAVPVSRMRTRLGVFSEHGPDVLLAVAVVALGAGLIFYLPGAFNVDSWLSLVGGREVWNSGIPHQETLTAIAHGLPWIDQQWLSQLGSYGLYLVGGLALLGVVNVALIVVGVGGAVVGARRLGATPASVLVMLPVCILMIVPSREVRTQQFVLPLFVAVAYLLASDSRKPSRRVLWCLPLLVVWANLHGTVSLGALLVCLRGLTLLWERRAVLLSSWRAWVLPLTLLLGAPVCMAITPYGLSIVPYYQTMLLGSTIRNAVTEWRPITSQAIIAVPFFMTIGVALWSFGRAPRATTAWERLALVALGAGSISVTRNALFFSLCALLVMPLSLSAVWARAGSSSSAPARRRVQINAGLALMAAACLLIAVLGAFQRPASSIELSYQRPQVLEAVRTATAADPTLKVMADVRFADWLLWRDMALRGRVGNDARFELLSANQMSGLQDLFYAIGPDWKRAARGYRLIVLDRRYAPAAATGFLRETGRRILYDDGNRLVILRSRAASR